MPFSFTNHLAYSLLTLIAGSSFALAQPVEHYSLAKEAPAAPAERLKDGFPDVKDVVWHKVTKGDETQWESTFSHDQAVLSLRYNEAGTLLWSDKKVDWAAIPTASQTAVQQALKEKLGTYTLAMCEERISGRLQQYAITVTTKTPQGVQTHLAIFDRAGVLNRIEQGQLVPQRGKKPRKSK